MSALGTHGFRNVSSSLDRHRNIASGSLGIRCSPFRCKRHKGRHLYGPSRTTLSRFRLAITTLSYRRIYPRPFYAKAGRVPGEEATRSPPRRNRITRSHAHRFPVPLPRQHRYRHHRSCFRLPALHSQLPALRSCLRLQLPGLQPRSRPPSGIDPVVA